MVARRPTHTPVRRAQLIAPFGPGALVVLENRVSAIVTGPATWLASLPSWRKGTSTALDELEIHDRRLEADLGVPRLMMPWTIGEDPHPRHDWYVPAARFPLSEHCTNPSCQQLVLRDPDDHRPGRCDSCGAGHRRSATLQVVPVVACSDGHLDDIEWSAWLHADQICQNPVVRYQSGSAPDRPRLSCRSCGSTASFDPREFAQRCSGATPWLPHSAPKPCDQRCRVVERTSTSVHYSAQLSALTLPIGANVNPELVDAFRNNPTLRFLMADGGGPHIVDRMVELCGRLGITTDANDVAAYLAAVGTEPPAGVDQRAAELDALTPAESTPTFVSPPDLIVEPRAIVAYRGSAIGDRLAAVTRVLRLRETRAMAGFSRIEPVDVPADRGYEQMWGRPRPDVFAPGAQDDWFPAYEVFGEGILIVLDADAVGDWLTAARSSPRLQSVRGRRPLRWLLAHTLAHMLMRNLAPASGYPLPAIRERIFATDSRTAFLLYTATGDAQGTLGGLVELGTPALLGEVFRDAAERATWCAADPVCIESDGREDLGTDPGACHHCLHVPETSCEAFNQGLDRAAVVGHADTKGWLHLR